MIPWYLNSPGYECYNTDLADVWTLDLETTNTEFGDPRLPENRVVLGTLRGTGGQYETFMGQEALQDRLQELASLGGDVILVAHNAKFELGWMLTLGVDTSRWLVWDTMLAEYVIAGNRRVPLDLGSVSRRYGYKAKDPVVDQLIMGGICPSAIPEKWLRERCERDVETTYQVYLAQRAFFDANRALGNVFFTRCILTPVLAGIERNGMYLDRDRVIEEYDSTVYKLAEIREKLQPIVGDYKLRGPKFAEFLYDHLKFEELRNHRGEPLRTAPTKRYPAGTRRTDGDTIEALVARTREQKEFRKLYTEYNRLDSLLTKNLRYFNEVITSRGGVMLGNIHQSRTVTHRTASTGHRIQLADGNFASTQFQNMPRAYKRLFRARDEEYVFIEPDGSQIEFRAAGQLAQDPQVCKDVVNEADIHRYTASVLKNKPESEVTKEERTLAKPDTFGPLYGKVRGTPAQVRYFEAFKAKYHKIAETQESWVQSVLRDKKLVTPWGLVFYWPDTRMERSGFITNSQKIYNAPIQSFATAEVIPIATAYTYWLLRARNARAKIVNLVHDSLPMECHKDDVDIVRDVVLESFFTRTYTYLETVYGIEMTIPLGVGFTVGTHWGEGKEEKYSKPFRRLLTDG